MEILIPTLAFFAGMSIGGYIIWVVVRGIPFAPTFSEITIGSSPNVTVDRIVSLQNLPKDIKVNVTYHPIDTDCSQSKPQ